VEFRTFAFQNIPPAPGGAPAPQVGQPAPGGPAAAPPPGGMLGGMFPLLIVVPLLIWMFISQSRQQKRQKELMEALKVGDQVVTQSGLVGKLTEKGERYVKVEIAAGIKVKMLRTSLVGLDTGEDAAKPAAQPAAK
jgi:preprotein translocase subunit YajC